MPPMKSAIPGQMCYTYEWRADNFKEVDFSTGNHKNFIH